MMQKICYGAAILMLSWLALPAAAHHSFAVHFVPEEMITVTGVVTKFRFNNPHGVVFFTVTDEDGNQVEWRAETNSPNLLKRRGWRKDSIVPGQEITIHGWPARDNSPLMRIESVTLPGGSVLTGQQTRTPSPGED